MTDNTDTLTEIFLDVAGESTLVERQEETPSHAPVEEHDAELEEAVSRAIRDDGLDDALDTGLGETSAATG